MAFLLTNKQYVGMKFHMLTIEEITDIGKSHERAYCLCECGNHTMARKSDVIRGHTMSCGCVNKRKHKKANYGVRWDPSRKKFEAYHGKKSLGFFFLEDVAQAALDNFRTPRQKA